MRLLASDGESYVLSFLFLSREALYPWGCGRDACMLGILNGQLNCLPAWVKGEQLSI